MPQSPRIVCPNLTDNERIKLQACIDRVRSGEREFFVRVTNHKVTRSRKRVDGEDYNAKRALAPHAHEGWLVAAPTNKKGEVYIHIFDEARAKDPNEFGHTRITMMGIQSFEVVRDPLTGQDITRPGPLGIEDARQPAPKQAQAQQAQEVILPLVQLALILACLPLPEAVNRDPQMKLAQCLQKRRCQLQAKLNLQVKSASHVEAPMLTSLKDMDTAMIVVQSMTFLSTSF